MEQGRKISAYLLIVFKHKNERDSMFCLWAFEILEVFWGDCLAGRVHVLDCCSLKRTASGGCEDFDKSDHTPFFVTLKQRLSSPAAPPGSREAALREGQAAAGAHQQSDRISEKHCTRMVAEVFQ